MAVELAETKSLSPLGSLPPSWRLAKLKDITTKIGTGATPRGGEKVYLSVRKNFALIRSQHVFDRYFNSEGLAFISEEHAAELQKVSVQPGDLLLNITGDGITFGRACLAPESILPACVNQHVSIIRPDKSLCFPGYLLAYLTHPLIKKYIESFNSGGSRRAITKGHIESFLVPLPPLPEQKAIAHILGTLDDQIELNREMNRTLEAMARAIFKSWFVNFDPVRAKMEGRQPAGMDAATAELFPDEFEDSELGQIPKGWRVGTLGDLGKVVTGKTPSTKVPEYFGGNVPFITPSDMDGSKIILRTARYLTQEGVDAVKSAKIPVGAILVSCIGSDMGKVACVVKNSVTNQQINSISVNNNYSKEYVYYNLSYRKDELQNLAGGGSAVPILNKGHFSKIEILIPHFYLHKIFDKLTLPISERIYKNNEQSYTIASLRDALLPKLLSGEIRVKEAEKFIQLVK